MILFIHLLTASFNVIINLTFTSILYPEWSLKTKILYSLPFIILNEFFYIYFFNL